MASYREHVRFSAEITDILIADAALTVAFALVFSGGVAGFTVSSFLYYIPIAFVAVSLSFVLHEYMHKIVAQRFGAIAAFRRWDSGIAITLLSSLFGFLIGLPGATMIYTNRFTVREEGYVSLAGPLTNFAVFLIVLMLSTVASGHFVLGQYLRVMISTTLFICVWLAFFNMLPIYPLDGSKVLRWNKAVYAVTMVAIFAFLYLAAGPAILPDMIFVLIIALIMSIVSRGIMRF
jgi:Zn-dependent protease